MKKILLLNIFLIVIFNILLALYVRDKGDVMLDNIIEDNVYKNVNYYKEDNLNRYINYKNENKNLNYDEVVKNVNINLDKNFYEDITDALNKYTNLVLVNKHYYLNEDYIPKDLVQIDYKYTSGINVLADKEAADAFELMSTDANAIGLNIKTISAYRNYEYQKKLYDNYLLNDPQEIVDTYSARAGHSEHQTGLAFDVYNIAQPYTSFGETNEYKWLKINAYKYGFIIRYTSDNSYITGYKDEPWHIRYVGVNNATYIYENNITLEEYILNKGSI
mgnify:CR=1 FL=1